MYFVNNKFLHVFEMLLNEPNYKDIYFFSKND